MPLVKYEARRSPLFNEEWLVEAIVPSAGNDAALIAVYNSEVAAKVFADAMNGYEALRAPRWHAV